MPGPARGAGASLPGAFPGCGRLPGRAGSAGRPLLRGTAGGRENFPVRNREVDFHRRPAGGVHRCIGAASSAAATRPRRGGPSRHTGRGAHRRRPGAALPQPGTRIARRESEGRGEHLGHGILTRPPGARRDCGHQPPRGAASARPRTRSEGRGTPRSGAGNRGPGSSGGLPSERQLPRARKAQPAGFGWCARPFPAGL